MENFLKVLTENATVREDFLRQMKEFVESLLGIAQVMDKAQSEGLPDTELTSVSGGAQESEGILNFTKAMETFNEHF